jgi:hypothetical protein
MQPVTHHPWSEIVPGVVIRDATGTYWKVLREHPRERGRFLIASPDGRVTEAGDPGHPVPAWIPTHDEAVHQLVHLLGAEEVLA